MTAELSSAVAAARRDRSFLEWEIRFLRRLLAGAVVVALFMGVTIVVLAIRGNPEPVIFASTSDGRVIPATRLDEPMMSEDAFREGVGRAILATFTLSFHDYRHRLDMARQYYTSEAFESLLGQFEATGVIKRLTDNYQVLGVVLEGTPRIVSTTIHEGVLYLTLETPILLTFRSGERSRSERLLVKTQVQRTKLSDNARGWAITQTVLERRTGGG